MPATDNQSSFLNRISIRRNQFTSIDPNHDQEIEDLDLFQKHVADRFSDLLSTSDPPSSPSAADEACTLSPPPLLSISWIRNLLDAFLCCEAEFKAVLVCGRDPSQFSRPPLDRLIPDLLERVVKALDICNAVTHGVDLVQNWQKLAQIAVAALGQNPVGEGQVRRARKALNTLLTSMVFDDKENANGNYHGRWTERNRSFGRRGAGAVSKDRTAGNFRSMSWSVAKSWSAAKQIQSMSANLVAPRGGEASGLAQPVFIMNTVGVFVMWALVAAIPCQERNGLATHFQVPRNLGWAQPIIGLQEKIGEEWKKKEKKGTGGLLEEVQRMEKVANWLVDFCDSFVFPLEEEKVAELAAQVAELAEICESESSGGENGVPSLDLSPDLFKSAVESASKAIHDFSKPLINMMKAAGWDLDGAANSIEPDVVYAKRAHKKYAFESHICQRMFVGFQDESFSVKPENPTTKESLFQEYLALREMDPLDAVGQGPDSMFGKFCQSKYLLVVHQKMEASFFGNLDQRNYIIGGGHPRTAFYQVFLKLAKSIWLLHRLAHCFEPSVKIFQVKRDSEFSEVYMESVVKDFVVVDGNEKPKVGLMVMPGFWIGGSAIQSQVYLTGIKVVE